MMKIVAQNFTAEFGNIKLEILKGEDGTYDLGISSSGNRTSLFENGSNKIITQINIEEIKIIKEAFNNLFSKVEDEYIKSSNQSNL